MKCNEDFLKCIRALKSSEYKNYVISYALKKDDTLKFLAYDRINQESIIEVVIGKKTEFNIVQDWDFNIDDYLFYDLENGYSLVYMQYEGMQQYLKYCKENGINKDLIKSLGLFEFDVMSLYVEKNINYVIIDEFTVNDQSIVLGHNKDSMSPYVTWKTDKTRSRGYDLGHYFIEYEDAVKDFISRSNLLYENQRSYEVIKLFGKKVLFTSERIRDSDLPKGIYKYEVRHDDECQGIMCEIAKRIFVNHWGTILSKEEIDLGPNGYRLIDEDKDVKWSTSKPFSLKQFIQAEKSKVCNIR